MTKSKILKQMKIYSQCATRARDQHASLDRRRVIRGHWGSPRALSMSLGWESVRVGWDGGPQAVLAPWGPHPRKAKAVGRWKPCCGVTEARAHVLRGVK